LPHYGRDQEVAIARIDRSEDRLAGRTRNLEIPRCAIAQLKYFVTGLLSATAPALPRQPPSRHCASGTRAHAARGGLNTGSA
jgi:hypothetical protein